MMLRAESSLRTAAMSYRLQPTINTPSTYHTTTQQREPAQPGQRRNLLTLPKSSKSPSLSLSRPSSTSASPSAPSSEPPPALDATHLDWNTFFKLRKTRRRIQLSSSIGTSFVTMLGGAQALAVSDMDKIAAQIPLDPFITLGLITFSCGGVGWLLGPILGTGIFNAMNGKYRKGMDEKEKEFYARIKRFRVDPSASSMANPVPDYYGERIASVGGYRQWLKDQRSFNKKRQTFV